MAEIIVGCVIGVVCLLIGLAIGVRHTKNYLSELKVQTARLDALQALFHEWKTSATEEIGAIYAFMQKYDLEAQNKIKQDLMGIEKMMKENGIDGGDPAPRERLYPRSGSRL